MDPEELQSQPQEDAPHAQRPKYQIILAWVLLAIVVIGVIMWLLEIATAGKLFGLLG